MVLSRAVAVVAENTEESNATTERVSPCTEATYRHAVPCPR